MYIYVYETNLINVFPHLSKILQIYMTLPITCLKAERNFSNL